LREIIIFLMEKYGYPGIFLLITLENIFPPIPSEIILPFGGFLTTYTKLSVPGVVLCATLGSVAGALVLYMVGCVLHEERLKKLVRGPAGRILRLKAEDIEKAKVWFLTKGKKTVLLCRCVPIVRSLISIPAGMSNMNLGMFLIYTVVGTVIWNTLLVGFGAILGASWDKIAWLVGEYSNIMLIVLVISGISGAIWFYRTKTAEIRK